jgi:hypothetical protein
LPTGQWPDTTGKFACDLLAKKPLCGRFDTLRKYFASLVRFLQVGPSKNSIYNVLWFKDLQFPPPRGARTLRAASRLISTLGAKRLFNPALWRMQRPP